MAGGDPNAPEPQGDGAVDHSQRLSRRVDLPGRSVFLIFQFELGDDVAWFGTADAGARAKPRGPPGAGRRYDLNRYDAPDRGTSAVARIPDVPDGCTILLRLAGTSLLRRLLAQALH